MSLKNCAYGFFGGAIVGGAISAALGAAAGATGAAILKASHYDGYDVDEATQMGAIGSAILGGGVAAIKGALAGCCETNTTNSDKKNGFITSTILYAGDMVLGGLTGYGVMNATSATAMNLGQTAAALAVGSAVTMIPVILVTMCICLPIVAATQVYIANQRRDSFLNIQRQIRDLRTTSSIAQPPINRTPREERDERDVNLDQITVVTNDQIYDDREPVMGTIVKNV